MPKPGRTTPQASEPLLVGDSRGRVSRRTLLKGGLGTAVLLAVPDLLAAQGVGAAASGARGHFFLYGVASYEPTIGPSVHAADASGVRAGIVGLAPVAIDLETLPVSSPDGSAIALVTVGDRSAR